jgi:hypothetical protein
LVVDEEDLDLELEKLFGLPVELRFSLDELVEPYLAMEQHADQEYTYPADLSRENLAAFCEASQRYFLLAPWNCVSDCEVFCVEGFKPTPLYAVVMGYGHQLYGLSLFDDFTEVLSLVRGDRPCEPYCFMDFPDVLDSQSLRQTLDREQIPFLSRNSCPLVYGNRTPATPKHYRLITEILNLITDRACPLAGVSLGSEVVQDSRGHHVRITWPIDLNDAY